MSIPPDDLGTRTTGAKPGRDETSLSSVYDGRPGTPLPVRKIVVYAHGRATLVEQADDGTWTCPVCQEQHKSTLGQSQTRPSHRPAERLLLGHDVDWKEREQERRDEDMGRPDFESPWAA